MEDLIGEIAKGFFRAIGYLIAEIFFSTVCYWVGWPVCKILTLGKYPSSSRVVYVEDFGRRENEFWCAAVGLLTIIIAGLYFAGQF